ncbi:hypothetical protein EC957_005687 [Mortierella hygrophila]|uniref:NACHT domain-containing protein n=1 Tax=Mortierella hygrophila TaxID=979708 RepID=A0A9P6K633_9FUNG|nr:hypothetical protein EC957_005687 [Mortierella hygrophila]
MSSLLPKDSSSRPASAQFEPGQYLHPSTNKHHSSVDDVQDENGSENDAKSYSSSRSSKSMLSRFKKKASHVLQGGSKGHNSETTPLVTTVTAPTSSTTTASSPTATAASILAISTKLTLGFIASPNDPIHQVEIVTTEVEPAHLSLDSRPAYLSSISNNDKTSLDYATIPASNAAVPGSNTATATAAGTTNFTIITPVSQLSSDQRPSVALRRNDIFPQNIDVPSPKVSLPRIRGRVESTPQLAFLISLLRVASSSHTSSVDNGGTASAPQDILIDAAYRDWVKTTTQYLIEKEQIVTMPSKLVAAFITDAKREDYRTLLRCFIEEFESRILDLELLQGLVHLVQSASPGFLDSDDLVNILTPISTRLQGVHQQSSVHPYHLTLAVSRILDVMAKLKVEDLDRVSIHEPLSVFLRGMKDSSDPYIMYQACYAFQALQYVPDDETALEAFLRHSTGLVDGLIKISGLVQLNFGGFLEGVKEGQRVIEEAASTIKSAFEGVLSLFESGRGVVDSVRESLGSGHKRLWYLAVRGATVLVREGRLAELNKLIVEAPCRRNPLFQMGICQLLGEIAVDETWDVVIRKQAVDFIGVLYRDDQDWGRDKSVKQWMWTILCRISRVQNQAVKDHASVLVRNFRVNGYSKLSSESPLRSRLTPPKSYPLLDRVQEIPEVEKHLHEVALAQLSDHWDHRLYVYIPPQVKASVDAADSDHSPLMEEVMTFLKGEREVLLLRGVSGAGKTTFNHKLAYDLWTEYTTGGLGGRIPLFINLPESKKPGEKLIAEKLRSLDFDNAQIKELKLTREFILICDGYDERQLLGVNLHTSNGFNGHGRWRAKLIVSCRSQYLPRNYLFDFQPKPRSHPPRTSAELYQEAVIIPFMEDQIEEYVKEFVVLPDDQVLLTDRPKWTVDEYMTRFKDIPNLMDLVGNPFLLSVSLQVLHLVIGDTQDLKTIQVTGVQLYDKFVERWMERGQERLQENQHLPSDQKAALKSLSRENTTSFSRHAINYMKNLATSMFERQEQAGNPTIEYSQHAEGDTWKAKFFGDGAEISVLRQASPIVGTGTQFQLLHRSMLEYFYSLDFFDPGETKKTDNHGIPSYEALLDSFRTHKMTKRSIVGEPLVVQFLGERARTDPDWKQMLLVLTDTMETDVESIQGASNAIAILLDAGISVNGIDLRTLRPQWYSST